MTMTSINGHFWELNNDDMEEKQKYVCNDCGYEWGEENTCQCPNYENYDTKFLINKKLNDFYKI